MNYFYRIATLPEKMAQVAICSDFFANGFAQFHQGERVVNHKVGMHFERQTFDAMGTRVLRSVLPIRDDLFFPLPLQHLVVFRRPAVSDPVRLGVGRSASGTSGKTDDNLNVEHFRKQNCFTKSVGIFLRVLGVGMNWISVATEGRDAQTLIFKSLLPGFGLGLVLDQFIKRAVTIIWIAAGADFHGFEAEGAHFVQHFIERKMLVNGVEDTDGDLLFRASRESSAKFVASAISCTRRVANCGPCASSGKRSGSGQARPGS